MALIERAVPGMRERGFGRILNVASAAVREPMPALMLSNAHRSAALAAFKTLARELAGDGVTVNIAAAGPDRHRPAGRALRLAGSRPRSWRPREVPAGRLGSVEEIAAAGSLPLLGASRVHHGRGAAGGRRTHPERLTSLRFGGPGGPLRSGNARTARRRARLPVRPGRRAHRRRQGPRGGLEGDVRRLPAAGPRERASRSCRSTPVTDYDAVRGRQAARGRRPLVPRVARHRPARAARRTTRPTARPCTGSATARTSSCCALIRERRRPGLRRLGRATCRRRARPACDARSCLERELPRTCCAAAAIDDCSRRASTAWSPSGSTCGASRRPTRSWRRRARLERVRAPQAAVFEDALAGVEAGRAGRLRLRGRRGPRRPGRRQLREHGADVGGATTWPTCSTEP